MTDAERLVYAAAFAASLRASYHCQEPMAYLPAAEQAAEDARIAVYALRDAPPLTARTEGMLTEFRGVSQ